ITQSLYSDESTTKFLHDVFLQESTKSLVLLRIWTSTHRSSRSTRSPQWGYSPTRENNKIEPSTDFDSYWFSLALNFDEYTSQFSQYAFSASIREELM
ncbi:hypothetical protein V1477_005423, partial [Vespula maculifrons]